MGIIQQTGSIIISRDIETVFCYISDLRNDQEWRKEINSTSASDQPINIGHIVEEDSFLSRRVPSYRKQLICTAYIPNNRIVYQTLPGNPFSLSSIRSVTAIGPQQTKFTYSLVFSSKIVKHGLGIGLPAFIVSYVTRSAIKKYLKKLRIILEQ
jgi:hypothetical protein